MSNQHKTYELAQVKNPTKSSISKKYSYVDACKKDPMRNPNIEKKSSKNCFKIWFKKSYIWVRTACIVLTFNRSIDGIDCPQILMVKDPTKKSNNRNSKNNTIEFPGGTVDLHDLNIYDTAIREFWEEALTGKELGEKWRDEYNKIKCRNDVMSQLLVYIKNRMKKSRTCVLDDNVEMKTIYYIMRISPLDANYLINDCGMIPVPLSVIKPVIKCSNSIKIYKTLTYKKPTNTYEKSNYNFQDYRRLQTNHKNQNSMKNHKYHKHHNKREELPKFNNTYFHVYLKSTDATSELVQIRRRDFSVLKNIYKKCMKCY